MAAPDRRDKTIRKDPWTWRVNASEPWALELTKDLAAVKEGSTPLFRHGEGRREIYKVERAGRKVFIKSYARPRLAKQIKHLFRNSRTRQEWEMGLAFEAMGLPVARHLAMAERKRFGLLMEDYLFQEWLEGYQSYGEWFAQRWQGIDSGRGVKARRAEVGRLAWLVRRMHDQGVLQRDFKADSVLVGPSCDYKLVDLERALIRKSGRGLSKAERIKNLAKIGQAFGYFGTSSDRLRFLEAYFERDGLSRKKVIRLASEIAELSELEFRKQARDRRVWAETENQTYFQTRIRGFQVSAHRLLSLDFLKTVVKRIDRAACETFTMAAYSGRPPQKFRAVWCDCVNALGHSPALYYRRAPFVPARAAIRRPGQNFGLLLYLDPGPPLVNWSEGASMAQAEGRAEDYGRDLGRTLRALHRLGITWQELRADSMLYDPAMRNPWMRFYVNRLDLLVMDRSPGKEEAREILDRVCDAAGLACASARAMKQAYARCPVRRFRAEARW